MAQSICQNPNCIPMIEERGNIITRIRAMIVVARQRNALRNLDPYLLDDIGLTEAQAAQEINRPIWDVPAFWRK